MPLLNLGPQAALPSQPQLYLFSSVLRAAYYSSSAWPTNPFQAAGDSDFYYSHLSDPSYPKWIAADYGNWQLVAIQGTTGALADPQWCGNMFAVGQVGFPGVPGKVHQYFGNVGLGLASDLLAVMGPKLNNVVLIGHSLGGAAARVAAYGLEASRPGCVRWVCSMGAPKTGNLEFALAKPWPVLRWQNVGDPVTLIPPAYGWVESQISDLTSWGPCQEYVADGDGWQLDPGGGLSAAEEYSVDQVAWSTAIGWWLQGTNLNALPHAMGQYAARIRLWQGPNLAPGSPLGIDLGKVDAFQQAFGAVDGFSW